MKKDRNNYSKEYVKKNRTFPKKNTVILVFILIIQISLGVLAFFIDPQPMDIIKDYTVTVEPLENGTLDIEYKFVWQAIDKWEDLTWVEIGMANPQFTVYSDSISSSINSYSVENYDGYVYLDIYFNRSYQSGETLEFSFKINQRNMLCKSANRYFYEFVPCWFNNTPIEHYEFKWKESDNCTLAVGAVKNNGYYVWEGKLDCGEYQLIHVKYNEHTFDGAHTVSHYPFDESEAYNGLAEEKSGYVALLIFVIIVLIFVEVYVIDSYVSYSRGRGFLTGYGYRVHVYGRPNPIYIKERDRQLAQSASYRGGGRGGCACACACACAGGGRAGCSQKDTYTNIFEKHEG